MLVSAVFGKCRVHLMPLLVLNVLAAVAESHVLPEFQNRFNDGAMTPCDATCRSKLPPYPAFASEYLNLAEMAVTGSLMDEIGRCNGGGCALEQAAPYNYSLRFRGNDWPPIGHTMVGHMRLHNVKAAIEAVVSAGIPGDFAELGVWRGGASIYAQLVLKCLGQMEARRALIFDAFEALAGKQVYGKASNFLSVTEHEVKHNFEKYGVLNTAHFFKGLFSDSLPKFAKQYRTEGRTIAVLRVDGNFYSSYQDVLYELYRFVPVGGIVIFDDVMSHKGVQQFWIDFTRDYSMKELLHPIDDHSAWFRKERVVHVSRNKYHHLNDSWHAY